MPWGVAIVPSRSAKLYVRLYGVDAAELATEYGKKAKEKLAHMVDPPRKAFLMPPETGRELDHFGRILARVYVEMDGKIVELNRIVAEFEGSQ